MGEKENLIKEYEDLLRKGMELKKRLKRWYMRGPSSVIEIWQTKQGLIEIIHRMDEIYEKLGMSKKFSYF